MEKNISLELYRIFCEVVRTGNMSAAAKELFISQPAVSMSIHQLEDKVGSPLLIRTSKGVRTTPEGAVLYEYLDKALGLIHMAEKKYEQMVSLEKGELHISAGDTVITKYLMHFIKQYVELYPEVTIKIFNGSSSESLTQLAKGEVDICFVNLPSSNNLDLFKIKECLKIHGCVIGGTKYKDLAERGIDFKDINENSLILLDKKTNTRRFLDERAAVFGGVLEPKIETESTELALELVKANIGIGITFRELVDIDNETIFEIPCEPPAPERSIGLVMLKNVALSTAAKKFVELLNIGEDFESL